MVIVGSLAAVGLSAVFWFAGLAKVRSLPTTRSGFAALGLPQWFVIPVVVAEGLTGVVLVIAPRIGGLMALVLLSGFTVALFRARRTARSRGVRGVRCNCFGSSADVTGWTFARNGALLVAGGLALFATKLVLTWPSVLVGVLAVAGAEVVRQIARVWEMTGSLFPRVGSVDRPLIVESAP